MPETEPTGSAPAAAEAPATGNFADMVGAEQPVNHIKGSPAPSPAGEQPKKEGAGTEKPAAQPDANPGGKKGEGDQQLFWGKFKTADDAKTAYDEAQGKITEQGQELSRIQSEQQQTQQFLTALDQALAAQPQLAEQLKAALAAVVGSEKGQKGDGQDGDKPLTRAEVENLLAERETTARTKSEIDAWAKDHKAELEADGEKLGHAILDRIKEDGLPYNARTLQLVYDALTKEGAAKKAAEEALKRDEAAHLDREGASAVGGGSPATKGNGPKGGFDELVGGRVNPNRI